ncbi:MAG: bifunctional hydroxymethylpyrimidine kinase/phosphomethylpyrimidine kinase [Pseudomonadota bacterium]
MSGPLPADPLDASRPWPIVWSIAGTDSGGGAGLSADQRAADAMQVHLCPVVAAVTAQNSLAVSEVHPVGREVLDAQLRALADDMPPQAIKTGLLGNAEQVACVAEWVDRLRERGPVALVVDPVLGATTGATFANAATLRAYQRLLLPRATLVTPNQDEAVRLLQRDPQDPHPSLADIPTQARGLQGMGCESVCITGGDARPALADDDHDALTASDLARLALDWMSTPHAEGWLAAERAPTAHTHGTGCTFATAAAAALARGFVSADALVLAKMVTLGALRAGQAAGIGAGPVRAHAGFITDPSLLPRLSWGEAPHFLAPFTPPRPDGVPVSGLGLYALVDSAERVRQVLAAGVRTVQLRVKAPEVAAPDWPSKLQREITESVAAAQAVDGAMLFINDHAEAALQAGASGVHLGQEDLLALNDGERIRLADQLDLGISSHSLWELCRAATLHPRYIACGPVWPTLTKAMPWRAQGLDNLAWWCAMSPAPVVAIGGILTPAQATQAARSGADGVCVVRGLGDVPAATVPAFQQALVEGRASGTALAGWPHPSLEGALSEPALP